LKKIDRTPISIARTNFPCHSVVYKGWIAPKKF